MLDQKDYFNSIAKQWDDICNHNVDKINKILDISMIGLNNKVLDVGTGTGILLPYLLNRVGSGGEITALDFSSNMLKLAKKKNNANNVSFVEGDIHNIDLSEEYYNHIICYSVFPHFTDKQKAIINMKKLLNKGGSIIICHSQSREDINNLHKNASKEVNEDRLPNISIIKELFINAGMKAAAQVDNSEMFVVTAIK